MTRRLLLLLPVTVLIGLAQPRMVSWAAADDQEQRIEQAIVLVEVTNQRGDWFSPWQRQRTVRSSGSGFVIAPNLVMTNAHVVSDAKQIILRRNGDNTPYYAEVQYIAHDGDLALLQVREARFSRGVTPLPLGDLPSLRTRVRTYGFPAGGERISRTEGVVSRFQFTNYLHSGADAHLSIQTDSAINPGNSGGPVIQDGKVVGVAFQSNPNLNDVGFFIPASLIKRFLKDIADSRYDGFGELGVVTSNLSNSAYRAFLKLPETLTGVVVDQVLSGTSAQGHLRPGDVITAIEGVPVAFDGTIPYFGHSLGFEQLVEEKQIGEPVRLSLWRAGRRQEVSFPLKAFSEAKRLRSHFDELPKYVLYAGMVFMVLDRDYLSTFGNFWRNASSALLYDHFFRMVERPRSRGRDTIVLTRVLPHEVNNGYRRFANSIVDTINGIAIESLGDVSRALASARGGFHEIKLTRTGAVLVLDAQAADAAHPEIMRQYGIRQDRRMP